MYWTRNLCAQIIKSLIIIGPNVRTHIKEYLASGQDLLAFGEFNFFIKHPAFISYHAFIADLGRINPARHNQLSTPDVVQWLSATSKFHGGFRIAKTSTILEQSSSRREVTHLYVLARGWNGQSVPAWIKTDNSEIRTALNYINLQPLLPWSMCLYQSHTK